MLRVGVVGGRLQGTEVAYLGGAAGYEVVLIDKTPGTPASGLAAESHVFDVLTDPDRARKALSSCDVVIPACENTATLRRLAVTLPGWGVPLAFHLPSFDVTRSKIASDALFAELDVPRPTPWPQCGFPVVLKPSEASGSAGVRMARDEREAAEAREELEAAGHTVVTQQFVHGPSLSLEVARSADGSVVPLVPTLLEFDAAFDCKRVSAPVDHQPFLLETLDAVACLLAEHVGLVGLMDVEVMVDDGVPRVIEIDARLPSQTPTVVYHATGLNLVRVLVDVFTTGVLPQRPFEPTRGVCYQHLHAAFGTLTVLGEHVMAGAGPLTLLHDVYGADEIVTDRAPGSGSWSATMICTGADAAEARARAEEATRRIAAEGGLHLAPDASPEAHRAG